MEDTARSRLLAVSGIIMAVSISAFASGLMFAYIPVKLLSLGFEPFVAAMMMPAVALGGMIGCLTMGILLRNSGHARVFMLLYALMAMSMLVIGLMEDPWLWLAARILYGYGITGVFIVAQSWLHDASTDEIRGRIITIFYIAYVVALGTGAYFIGMIEITGNTVPLIATFFIALAMLPVGLTQLPPPEPPEEITVSPRQVWKISPVGLAGMLTVGGVTMTLQTFAPIYVSERGFDKADVGLTMLLMQIGLMFVQMPMGALSDRIDRRYVLLMVAAGATVMSLAAISGHAMMGLAGLIVIFALWNGCNETLYSVSSALANDRADPKQYVMLSSTQMVAWSASAFVLPLIATLLIRFLPLASFMYVCGVVVFIFGIFVFYRLRQRPEMTEEEDREQFQWVTAQTVYPGEYANPDSGEENAGITEGLS